MTGTQGSEFFRFIPNYSESHVRPEKTLYHILFYLSLSQASANGNQG